MGYNATAEKPNYFTGIAMTTFSSAQFRQEVTSSEVMTIQERFNLSQYDIPHPSLFEAIKYGQLNWLKLILGFAAEKHYRHFLIKHQDCYIERMQFLLEEQLLLERKQALEQFCRTQGSVLETTDERGLIEDLKVLLKNTDQKTYDNLCKTYKINIQDFVTYSEGYYHSTSENRLEFKVVLDFNGAVSLLDEYAVLSEALEPYIERCLGAWNDIKAKYDRLQALPLAMLDVKAIHTCYKDGLAQVRQRTDQANERFAASQKQLAGLENDNKATYLTRRSLMEMLGDVLPQDYQNLDAVAQAAKLREFGQADITDEQGNTLLHLLVELPEDVNSYISFLLSHDVNPLAKNQHGKTPFSLAVDSNRPERIALLLKAIQTKKLPQFDSLYYGNITEAMKSLREAKTILDSYNKKLATRCTQHWLLSALTGYAHFLTTRLAEYETYCVKLDESLAAHNPYRLMDAIAANARRNDNRRFLGLGKSELNDNMHRLYTHFSSQFDRANFEDNRDKFMQIPLQRKLQLTEEKYSHALQAKNSLENVIDNAKDPDKLVLVQELVVKDEHIVEQNNSIKHLSQANQSLQHELENKNRLFAQQDTILMTKDKQIARQDKQINLLLNRFGKPQSSQSANYTSTSNYFYGP
jgi:hypothetical protein